MDPASAGLRYRGLSGIRALQAVVRSHRSALQGAGHRQSWINGDRRAEPIDIFIEFCRSWFSAQLGFLIKPIWHPNTVSRFCRF
jgi:hypothetical protein